MRRVRVPTEGDFGSTLRGPEVTSRVGVWLGVCFGVAFVTGVISHEAYVAHPLIAFPTRPVWGYRLTQGLHVVCGTAAVPLLLVKLWSVYPKLFARPPHHLRELLRHAWERASVGVLVAAAIFQLATGLADTAQWYPWAFHFRATHDAVGWIAIGALLVHVAVKLPLIRSSLAVDLEGPSPPVRKEPTLSRRGLVRAALLASGTAVLATAGSTVPALRTVSLLAVRSGDGPAGVPVNKSARAAEVVAAALSPGYRLVVAYDGRERSFSRSDLARLEQHTAELPIACVEGWSASGRWSGVRVRDLLDLVGAPRRHDVRVVSLQPRGPFRETTLPAQFADDPLTLLALSLSGEPLAIDHGYPCRLIAPDRPGVLQTKWVGRLEVLA
ncbi:MAG TPA: molybdopterin-dependent oxidoreductase [Marmoricola sp.]|nr:molybdopterin-dependent oxidoreductase [Marmoricola sp.]